ncbi:MAG: guanylate kinase [Actinobacteria bacterium]|nr:guanylate kinase [Actinomycetota bacterium]
MRGHLVVVAGPSGAGKGSIVRRLLERDPHLRFSVSMTTRPPRPGEVDGRDYHFVDHDEFDRVRDAGGFLEWFEVYGELKGTPRAAVERELDMGHDVVLEIDVQGAMAVRRQFPDALLVFVKPPSREVQRGRFLERHRDDPNFDPAALERRLAEADHEEQLAEQFDAVVVNDDLERAVEQVAAILARRRSQRST